jgi:hypothetical protein
MAKSMLKKNVYSLPSHILLLLATCVLAGGFSTQKDAAVLSQPKEERKAQDALPQAGDPMWGNFAKCKVHYNNTKHTYSIDYTPDIKALAGKPLTVSGFIMPLEATEKFSHFLLSKRTPTCAFCPPGEPNEIVEVFTKKPLRYTEGIVVVTGTFGFTNNPDLGLFFQLKDSTLTDSKPLQPKNKPPLV